MTLLTARPTLTPSLHMAISKLPPFSAVAVRLMRIVSQDDVSFGEVTKVLSTDASFSAEVLRVANSSLFAGTAHIDSIIGALMVIGLDRLSVLITTTALWKCVPGSMNRDIIARWWRHNLACALLAQRLPRKNCPGDLAYTAGLLHSAGQLALLGAYPSEYAAMLSKPGLTTEKLREMERRKFHADHCQVGTALLTAWKLPPPLVESVRSHDAEHAGDSPISELVHNACLSASRLGFAMVEGDCDEPLPPEVERMLDDPIFATEVMERIYEMEKCLI